MNSAELRALQAPLKDKYRHDPSSALVTLSAIARTNEGISCSVRTGRALVEAGLHPATGGDGTLACSGDMLLEALAACAGVTLRAVATAIGANIEHASITVEGDLDFRGTLGVSKEVPVGFQAIRLHFNLGNKLPEDVRSTLIRLTERYCVVLRTLLETPKISTAAQTSE
jgi:uncharacterized OsmC-like protein